MPGDGDALFAGSGTGRVEEPEGRQPGDEEGRRRDGPQGGEFPGRRVFPPQPHVLAHKKHDAEQDALEQKLHENQEWR